MNLDHYKNPEEEVRNWIAIAARKMRESGLSPALIFSVSVSSDSENVFYKDDFPATPEGDKLLSESTQLTTEQHNYLNLFWVGTGYLDAIGTDKESAYRKEFEKRAAQAEREEYSDMVLTGRNRANAAGTRTNTLKDRYQGEYLNLISEGKNPAHKIIMRLLEQHDDITVSENSVTIKGGKTLSVNSCANWLKELKGK